MIIIIEIEMTILNVIIEENEDIYVQIVQIIEEQKIIIGHIIIIMKHTGIIIEIIMEKIMKILIGIIEIGE